MENIELEPGTPPQRLCSEIQLFDLCELSACRYKAGRFCGNVELVERFEKIADQEMRSPEQYIDEELDDDETDGDYEDYDDGDDCQERDWDEESLVI